LQDGPCKIHNTDTILRESGYEGVKRNELVQLWLQDLPRPSRASLYWAPRREHTVHALVREIMTTVNRMCYAYTTKLRFTCRLETKKIQALCDVRLASCPSLILL
jgi:hypothetical protein